MMRHDETEDKKDFTKEFEFNLKHEEKKNIYLTIIGLIGGIMLLLYILILKLEYPQEYIPYVMFTALGLITLVSVPMIYHTYHSSKCPHCKKQMMKGRFVYCHHCGVKLRDE